MEVIGGVRGACLVWRDQEERSSGDRDGRVAFMAEAAGVLGREGGVYKDMMKNLNER